MKKYSIWIVLGVIAILLIGVIIFFSIFSPSHSSTVGNFATTSSQTSSTTAGSQVATITTNTPSITILTATNSKITTKDFLHNGTTVQDPANPSSYYIAGSSGACTSQNNCPKAGTNPDYNIIYNKNDGSFIVGIASEPLGTVRLEAEKALQTELGIPMQQMCSLKYLVITTTYVNQQYGGRNLGFSFCPGSVELPS